LLPWQRVHLKKKKRHGSPYVWPMSLHAFSSACVVCVCCWCLNTRVLLYRMRYHPECLLPVVSLFKSFYGHVTLTKQDIWVLFFFLLKEAG
jgi:hypothetical protein